MKGTIVIILKFCERLALVVLTILLWVIVMRGLGNLCPQIYDYDSENKFLREHRDDIKPKILTEREAYSAFRKGYRADKLFSYYADQVVTILFAVFALAVSLTTSITWFRAYHRLKKRSARVAIRR